MFSLLCLYFSETNHQGKTKTTTPITIYTLPTKNNAPPHFFIQNHDETKIIPLLIGVVIFKRFDREFPRLFSALNLVYIFFSFSHCCLYFSETIHQGKTKTTNPITIYKYKYKYINKYKH